MKAHDEVIEWLRDAYSMERGLETGLKKQADNEDLDMEVRQQVLRHLEETRRHAELVQAALRALGHDPSTLKTSLGVAGEALRGIATTFARDERVKDLLASYASEHFEIACYTALAIAAERAGMPGVAATCQQIIPDEERMAQWLRDALPRVVAGYLTDHRDAA